LFFLQTFRHEQLYTQSENNRIRIQPVIPKRGIIYDRNRRILADNRASYSLSVVPMEAANTHTVERLSSLLNITTDEVERRIDRNLIGRFQPALVKRDIGLDKIVILEEQNEAYPGAVYSKDQARKFKKSLGSDCFTGYVGEISSEEMKKLDASIYRAGTIIGKAGVEKHYDRNLRGREGTQYMEVAASGQLLGLLEDYPGTAAEPGSDLVLTIDLDIQEVAHQSFGEFCCGAAIVMDPRDGEILALVSKPSNDANIFSTVMPDSLWKAIIEDSSKPLLNRPLVGLYPPGSPYKLVIAGAGLERGLIDKNSLFPSSCTGGYRFGNRIFHCWERSGHGSMTLIPAIAQSCDVYFYQLGRNIGLEEIYEFSRACGFGQKTDIDLPQESSGNVPDTDWYDRKIGEGKWTKAVVLNLAIGQGELLVTPLQVAQFYCGLANKGRVYKPHLLKSVIEPDGRETSIGGEFSYNLPFSEKTLGLLMEGLIEVVQGEHGTARGARIDGVVSGGKTGTAQNPHGENHSWYIGFAPADNPEIVACVIIENAGHGSEWAAPAVRKIINAYLKKHNTPDSSMAIIGAN
jgi:penicillin-binding protein 2